MTGRRLINNRLIVKMILWLLIPALLMGLLEKFSWSDTLINPLSLGGSFFCLFLIFELGRPILVSFIEPLISSKKGIESRDGDSSSPKTVRKSSSNIKTDKAVGGVEVISTTVGNNVWINWDAGDKLLNPVEKKDIYKDESVKKSIVEQSSIQAQIEAKPRVKLGGETQAQREAEGKPKQKIEDQTELESNNIDNNSSQNKSHKPNHLDPLVKSNTDFSATDMNEASSRSSQLPKSKRTPVRIGVSAPRTSKPGDEFIVKFSAYHPKYESKARSNLKHPGSKVQMNVDPCTNWEKGVKVNVELTGTNLKIKNSLQTFIWNGQINNLDFEVSVNSGIKKRKKVVVVFVVKINQAIVAKISLPLLIKNKSGLFEKFFLQEEQKIQCNSVESAYASFDVANRSEVLSYIYVLEQQTGMKFYRDCLSLYPDESRKKYIKKIIAQHDMFYLFWSINAKNSRLVTFEWECALKKPGKDHIQTIKVDSNDTTPFPIEIEKINNIKRRNESMNKMNKQFFFVGCVLSCFVAMILIWSFALGTLSNDQRMIVRVLLSLSSAFASGSFIGAFTVKAHGLLPGMFTTCTGGFGVWFLTPFLFFTNNFTFDVVVQPHGPNGVLDTFTSGIVSIQIGDKKLSETIDPQGQARFKNITQDSRSTKTPVLFKISGFLMKDANQNVELKPGEVIYVPMVPESKPK